MFPSSSHHTINYVLATLPNPHPIRSPCPASPHALGNGHEAWEHFGKDILRFTVLVEHDLHQKRLQECEFMVPNFALAPVILILSKPNIFLWPANRIWWR